jgi:hypothetical protein
VIASKHGHAHAPGAVDRHLLTICATVGFRVASTVASNMRMSSSRNSSGTLGDQMFGHINRVDATQWLVDHGSQPAFHDAPRRLPARWLPCWRSNDRSAPHSSPALAAMAPDAGSVESMTDDTLLGRHHDLVTPQLVALGLGRTPTLHAADRVAAAVDFMTSAVAPAGDVAHTENERSFFQV